MSLPKLSAPLFEEVIPSTKQAIRFRPFLVKEEKILLIAQSGGTKKEVINAIKQIINNCVVMQDGSSFDVGMLALFDLEYLFIKIRAKSVDNIVKLKYIDHEDEKTYEVEINLDEIQVKFDETNTNKIKVKDDIGIIMKYPTPEITNKIEFESANKINEVQFTQDLIKECIDKIYDADNVYVAKEIDPKEFDEFIDSMPIKALEDIKKFFETIPKITHTVEYTNSKGTKREIELSSIDDFFTLQ